MSLRLEMLQVARLAPKLLSDSAELVRDFLWRQQNPDGGFKDRTGKSDLYYTVFGIDALVAVQTELPVEQLTRYIERFGAGESLDFVHLCCLARCRAGVSDPHQNSIETRPYSFRDEILRRIETFRSKDGGYSPTAGSESGTAYGCFLALGAYQDLQAMLPEPLRLVQCLKFLETEDGAWANERHVKMGSTNATAAAATLARHLDAPVSPSVGDWLLGRCHSQGGFLASSQAPIPDLLSTATALHALAGMQTDFRNIKERCLDYVDSLWTNEGSFHGNWADEALDTEYTFYGLLALGHLSL